MKKILLSLLLTLALVAGIFGFIAPAAAPPDLAAANAASRSVQVGDVLGVVSFRSIPGALSYPVTSSTTPIDSLRLLTFSDNSYIRFFRQGYSKMPPYPDAYSAIEFCDSSNNIITYFADTFECVYYEEWIIWVLTSYDFGGRTVSVINDASIQSVIRIEEQEVPQSVTRAVQAGDVLGMVEFQGTPNVFPYPSFIFLICTFDDGSSMFTRQYEVFEGLTQCQLVFQDASYNISVLASGEDSSSMMWMSPQSFDFGRRKIESISNYGIESIILFEATIPEEWPNGYTSFYAGFCHQVTGEIVFMGEYINGQLQAQIVSCYENLIFPIPPEIDGYTFDRWEYSGDAMQYITYEAVYTEVNENNFTVTFKDWDGAILSAQQVVEGAAAIAPTDPVRLYNTWTGFYTFTGWDVSFDNVTSDLIVTAQYVFLTHTITFLDWDGTVLSTQVLDCYTRYTEVTAPTVPVRPGYIFTGWPSIIGSQTGITSDAAYTAGYVPGTSSRPAVATDKLYNVFFNIQLDPNDLFTHRQYDNLYYDALTFSDGTKIVYREGDHSMATSQLYYYDGSSYITIFVTAEHYWPLWANRSYDFGGKQIASVPMPEILQLISIPEFSVQFQNYDGAVLADVQASAGAGIVSPVTPTRSGYTFLGWSVGLQAITADTVAVAMYDPACLVRFYNWDSTLLASMFVDIGGAATAPASPVRTGYMFTGWDSAFSNINADIDITAQFSVNVYTVIFKNYNGAVLSTQQVEHGSTAVAPEEPARAEHVFTGWSSAFTAITSDITITAQFAINNYTVVFLDHDGEVLSTQQVVYSGAATAPEDPTREGYTFTGWDKEFSSVTENITVRPVYEDAGFELPDFNFEDAGIVGGLLFAVLVLAVAFILLAR